MTELIEAIARAIADPTFEPIVDDGWKNWIIEAQAALTAITDAGYRIVKDEPVAWMDPIWITGAEPYATATSPVTVYRVNGWLCLYAAPGDEK